MAMRRTRLLTASAVMASAVFLCLLAPTAGAATSQDLPPEAPTTSQVIDNRDLGEIIQKPNAGKPAESPGDPGGWLQVSLFFLICGVVILMSLYVWRRSDKLRAERKAAGLDPVDLAQRTGEGVRHEPTQPPTPVD